MQPVETLARCHHHRICSAYLLMTPASGITLAGTGGASASVGTTAELPTSTMLFCLDLSHRVFCPLRGGWSLSHQENVSYRIKSVDGQTVWHIWIGVALIGPAGLSMTRRSILPAPLLPALPLLLDTCPLLSLESAGSMSRQADANSNQLQSYKRMCVSLALCNVQLTTLVCPGPPVL